MGRVHVGEFSFDSLKEAQDYATKLKADPNYVPPKKEEVLAPGEGETNDGFVPSHDPELHSHGNETEDSQATQTSDAASSVVFHDPQEPSQEPEFLPDNYEDMTEKQKEDHDLDTAQAVYESSTPEEQAQIDAENDTFDKEHKINDYADLEAEEKQAEQDVRDLDDGRLEQELADEDQTTVLTDASEESAEAGA